VADSKRSPNAGKVLPSDYTTVAASQTDAAIGDARPGALLEVVIVVPATTSPGAISVKDGGGSSITIFTGGASSVADLKPFAIPLGMRSTSTGWKITTGANVSVIAIGQYTDF
jgi:hypothetical protein